VEVVFLPSCVCNVCVCVRVRLFPKFILTASGSHAYFIIQQRRYRPQGLSFHRICRVVYENVIRQHSFHKKTDTSGPEQLSIITKVVARRAQTRSSIPSQDSRFFCTRSAAALGPTLSPVGTWGLLHRSKPQQRADKHPRL